MSGPQRTCIACRQTRNQGELVRFVNGPDGQVLVDYRHRLPGRGAYTCLDQNCLDAAVKRRLFARAFRGNCNSPELEELRTELGQAFEQRLVNLLGMVRKSGQGITGTGMVLAALKKNPRPALVIIGVDVSKDIKEKLTDLAERCRVPVFHLFSKDRLGQLFGKGERSAIALAAGTLADTLMLELQRYLQMVREN